MAFNHLDFPNLNPAIVRVYPKFHARVAKVAVPAHF